jgi:hypothetical protein
MDDCQPVSVSRRIEAPAEVLFACLADPARHRDFDGSGMVREAVDGAVVTGVGDTFTIKMHNPRVGDYVVTSHVVEYVRDRRIAWEPVLAGASRPEHQARIGDRQKQRWIYELAPDGPGATVVTETYDCTQSPERVRNIVRNGEYWVESMTATLEKLDQQCTQ